MDSLLQRLKKRKLIQWAVAYLAGAFVVFQVMDALAEPLSLSLPVQRAILALVVVGFFCALVLAWYHGEKGRQRVSGPELLIITLILVVAGAGIVVLGGGEQIARPEAESAEASARFAALNDDRPVIAVLPLTNLSAGEDNSQFAAGIHEELLRLLSLVRELGVISRTSVLRYASTDRGIPQIGEELGAHYIVEGSVQESEGRVRIHVQLIDATTDQHVWADRYDRSLEDVFALQSEVAQAIAGELQAVISPEERLRIEARPTQDPIAYDLYLRTVGLNSFVREEFETASALLRRATQLDPDFALAHAKLAMLFRHGEIIHRSRTYDSAVARAELALELAPELPGALATQGLLLAEMDQVDTARALLRRAVTLDPNYAGAWASLSFAGWVSGDNVGGALAGREAARLNPLDGWSHIDLGYSLLFAGMFDETAQWMARALDLATVNVWAFHVLALAAMEAGAAEAARTQMSRMREASGDSPFALYFAALVELWSGKPEAAEPLLVQLCARAPEFSNGGGPGAQMALEWLRAKAGAIESREKLRELRPSRLAALEVGTGLRTLSDLMLISSALDEDEELLRLFLEAAGLEDGHSVYRFRNAPWLDPIRDRTEFLAWLQQAEARLAAQRRELLAMGPWTPEEVLGLGLRNR